MRWSEIKEGTRCWKGYKKHGMKTMFGKRVPDCRKNTESVHEGMIDREMAKAALASLSAIDTSSSQWRKTKRGSKKTQELEDLQVSLSLMGYKPGKADGWFGKKTARAVMKFQKDHGLKVDGDPGKNTINKMIDVLEKDFYGKDDDSDIKATYLDKDGKDSGIPATRGKHGYDNFDYDKFRYNIQKAIDASENLDEDLRKWFKQKWKRFGPDGKIRGDCARGDSSEGKPKCLPAKKAYSMSKKDRATSARRKRRKDPDKNRSGKAKNVKT